MSRYIKRIAITLSVLSVSVIATFAAPDFTKCIGFASIDGEGNQKLTGGVTGGAGGPVVTVNNIDDLVKYCSQEGPVIIIVEGTIQIPNDANKKTYTESKDGKIKIPYSVWVTSDKTIVGKGNNATIKSGGFIIGSWDEQVGFSNDVTEPPADAIHNIIIQNLTFDLSGGPTAETDGISIFMHAHHIWVDHCTFKNAVDGALDIKRGANYATFSYIHFYKTDKTSLCGHADTNEKQDVGFLKVTYHHNYFEETDQRGPRVRFGMVHVFNNYYVKTGMYALGTGVGAKIYAEKNIMENGKAYSKDYDGGVYEDHGSTLTNSPVGSGKTGSAGFKPSDFYTYSADDPATAKELALQYAGAGKVDFTVGVKNTGFKPVTVSNGAKTNQGSVFSLLGVNVASQKGTTANNAAGTYIIQNSTEHKKIMNRTGK